MEKTMIFFVYFIALWVISGISLFLTACINVLTESIKQKKSPNTVVVEWSEKYIPIIQEKAENIRDSFFSLL